MNGKKEDEWAVLPVHFYCDEKYTGKRKYKNLNNKTLIKHVITKCQSENIEHILEKPEEWQEYYDILPRSYQKTWRDRVDITVWTSLLSYKHQCSKCGIKSEPALWDGKLGLNRGECPACRQVNYILDYRFPGDPPPPRNISRDNFKKASCYKCRGEYHANEFVPRRPNIIGCLDCARMNKLCLKCKNEGYLCPNVDCGRVYFAE